MRTADTQATPNSDGDQAIHEVARGGALNLIGNAVYGLGNFLLLGVVTTQLGADGAGVFLVAVALFNIMSKVCELGATTGIIRTVSRDTAVGKQHELRANAQIAALISVGASVAAAVALFLLAPSLANVFASGKDVAEITDVLHAIAPWLAFSSVYTVLIYGSRGFNTMVPQVTVEKIGRALAQPLVVLVVLLLGGGVVAGATAWAVVQALFLIPAVVVFVHLLRRAERDAVHPIAGISKPIARAFTSYCLPRALGQVFQVAVVWMDTLIIAALIGTRDAGIYAAGTRYLLIGLFTAEAIMQVLGPRLSGLLAVKKRLEAARLYSIGTAWQTAITWNVYLIILFFSTPLLRVFGPEYVAAGPALVWLSFAMLVSSLFGPSDTVILMSGRSRLSLFNAFVAVSINVAGNFWLVPKYGITAAGATWAVTLVVAAALPAYQARRDLGVHPFSAPLRAAVLCTALGMGVPVVLSWLVLGPTFPGLAVAAVLGTVGFLVALRPFGAEIHLDTLIRSLLPSGRQRVRADIVGNAGTIS